MRTRTVVCFDGVGTDGLVEGSILAHCVNHLAPKVDADAKWIPWGGSDMLGGVGGGHGTWEENSRAGVQALAEWMRNNPDQHIILTSFSGGSKPAHDFLEHHPEFHDRVLGAAFLSDPWKPKDRGQAGVPSTEPRYGIMGERHTPISDRAWWTTYPTDPISSAWPDALLRYLADTSSGDMDEIITKGIEKGRLGRFQLSWQLGIIQRNPLGWFLGLGGRIGQLGADVRAYMTGDHTRGYIDPFVTHNPDGTQDDRSLAIRLADTVAWGVRKRYG